MPVPISVFNTVSGSLNKPQRLRHWIDIENIQCDGASRVVKNFVQKTPTQTRMAPSGFFSYLAAVGFCRVLPQRRHSIGYIGIDFASVIWAISFSARGSRAKGEADR